MSSLRGLIRSESHELVLLAGPITVMQLSQFSNGLIDNLMVGQLGAASLAGVALGNATYFLFILTSVGILAAISPWVSQAYGSEDLGLIGRSIRQGIWIATALSLCIMVLLWYMAPIWLALRQDPGTVHISESYIRAVLWGTPAFLWFVALRNFITSITRPWSITFITMTGVGINALANYVLMYGKFGAPAMGMVGTGWATAIVNWFMFLAVLIYVLVHSRLRNLAGLSRVLKLEFSLIRDILRIGLPIGGSLGLEVTLFSSVAFFAGTLGPSDLAAHNIAIQCASFAFLVPLSIGMASTVRVGLAVGQKNPDRAAWAGYLGMILSTLFMVGTSIVFWVFPRNIVGLFLSFDDPANTASIAIAVSLLGIAAVFQIVDGIQVSAAGALRGLKDTRKPMIMCFISYWILGLPLAVALGYGLDLGTQGFWWGLVFGLAAASVLQGHRFMKLSGRLKSSIP